MVSPAVERRASRVQFQGRPSSAADAAHCTAHHGVGFHADPPMMECAIPTGGEVRAPVACRVSRELYVQPWYVMPTTMRPMPDHESSQSWTSRSSNGLLRTSAAASAARRRRPLGVERDGRQARFTGAATISLQNCSKSMGLSKRRRRARRQGAGRGPDRSRSPR
jgi:hypothetical protein